MTLRQSSTGQDFINAIVQSDISAKAEAQKIKDRYASNRICTVINAHFNEQKSSSLSFLMSEMKKVPSKIFNTYNSQGSTALLLSAAHGSVDLLRYLLLNEAPAASEGLSAGSERRGFLLCDPLLCHQNTNESFLFPFHRSLLQKMAQTSQQTTKKMSQEPTQEKSEKSTEVEAMLTFLRVFLCSLCDDVRSTLLFIPLLKDGNTILHTLCYHETEKMIDILLFCSSLSTEEIGNLCRRENNRHIHPLQLCTLLHLPHIKTFIHNKIQSTK